MVSLYPVVHETVLVLSQITARQFRDLHYLWVIKTGNLLGLMFAHK
jgi:hypothetical protein